MSDFKPCPFCEGTDIRCTNHGKISRDPFHCDDDVWSMCCYACGATFPNRYKRELLVEAWNRRPQVASVVTAEDEIFTLRAAVENLRGGSDPDRRIDAAFRIASRLERMADVASSRHD